MMSGVPPCAEGAGEGALEGAPASSSLGSMSPTAGAVGVNCTDWCAVLLSRREPRKLSEGERGGDCVALISLASLLRSRCSAADPRIGAGGGSATCAVEGCCV